jgi:hypothetical protein
MKEIVERRFLKVVTFFDPDFSPFDGSVNANIYCGRERLVSKFK